MIQLISFQKKYQIYCLSKIVHPIYYPLLRLHMNLILELFFHQRNIIFQKWITKNVIDKGFLENKFYFLNEEKYNFNTKRKKN
jgi:hypothetical protein